MNYKKHTSDFDVVNEAINNYAISLNSASIFNFNKDNNSFSDFFDNKMLVIQVIKKGLPYKVFNVIKKIIPFTEDDWANYLNISKKSLQRYSNDKNHLFKPIHTEKIIEIAEVTNYGKDVFDSTEQFYLWLNTPSFIFNNLKPAELLQDSYGKELVLEELSRIEHGIFA
ncbi:antitoxin Xre/MbcA/ParS toxin-binding domain-containing protein [Polaribacter sp. Hel_I_88]|uniref:type II RES/Xre toxin-antitoxin system antitoxin n=1 Tax=Polaribacter sp. Hel_I_88 TaxID=1250006 RepID=UPI00055D37CC|nr:antitoxin Xre/MbcA/ParS toxin-binding domain-containing protein [Polaribacter sp. Hel_I_88]